MKTKCLKWAYMTVTLISLSLCVLLLWMVFSAEKAVFHAPPGAIISAQKGNTIITEEYLTSGMRTFLPEDFPMGALEVRIKNEQVIVSAALQKSDIKSWIKQSGINLSLKQNLALSFMPKKIDVQIYLDVASEKADIMLSNMQLSVNGSFTQVPMPVQELLQLLNNGINQTLKSNGTQYTEIKIDDGFIELVP